MIPSELQQLFNEKDLEDINIQILKISFDNYRALITVVFEPDTYYHENEVLVSQTWTIKVYPLVEYKITSDPYQNFAIRNAHPFLLRHIEKRAELYINGPIKNEYEVAIALLIEHQESIGGYDYIDEFMDPVRLQSVASAQSALLAKGPISIIEKYKSVLDDHRIESNILSGDKPTYWNGEAHVDTTENLKILDMGSTYFIAECFEFSPQRLR